MSIFGEATGVFGLLGKGWTLLRDRIDPARAQAKRLIKVFEAYGILRQQIPRILPSDLKLPNAAFSTPDKLKDKVTPELLDWAADYLAIKRAWLDGTDQLPHLLVHHYKSPAGYRNWLLGRIQVAPDVQRSLMVWKPQKQEMGPKACGPFCLVYEEASDGLDGVDFRRYWLLSDHWSLEHAPCIENLLALIAVCLSIDILVLGRDLPLDVLRQVEAGKKLLPEAAKRVCGIWHPEDLVQPLLGQDSDWRQARWSGAQAYLASDGIVIAEPHPERAPAR